ncbi:MAG: MupA/Atu3671 family FMN-dependent luciferase-like monooxygenase [Planctomycetota bacterium]
MPESKSAKIFSCYVIGSESLLAQCTETLLEKGHSVLGVITASQELRNWANGRGLAVIDAHGDYASVLKQAPCDYLFSITHLALIRDDALACARRGGINFHDGPLPRYAGLFTPVWGILNGATEWAVSWHFITAGVDEGDVLKQRSFEVSADETTLTLNTRCYEHGMETFAELVDELATGRAVAVKQNFAGRVCYQRDQRPPGYCRLDFTQPASKLAALVRALDFGKYANPFGLARLPVGGEAPLVMKLDVLESGSAGAAAGTVLALTADAIDVAADAGTAVRITRLAESCGRPLPIAEFARRRQFVVGTQIAPPDATTLTAIETVATRVVRHEEFWVERLARLEPLELPFRRATTENFNAHYSEVTQPFNAADPARLMTLTGVATVGDAIEIAALLFLGRFAGKDEYDVHLESSALRAELAGGAVASFPAHVFASRTPLRVVVDPLQSVRTVIESVTRLRKRSRRAGTYALDIAARYPRLAGSLAHAQATIPVLIERCGSFETAPRSRHDGAAELTLRISDDGKHVACRFDERHFAEPQVMRILRGLDVFVAALVSHAERPLIELPLSSREEERHLLETWNDTRRAFASERCVHQFFEASVARAPAAIAVSAGTQQLSYAELDRRATQLGNHLRSLGIGPESLVGVHMHRTVDLMVALVGIHKAGGAYVPLDPTYPQQRLELMVSDSRLAVVLTQTALEDKIVAAEATKICLDRDWPTIARASTTRCESGVKPENLAYVIYTSGSTGKPKGVQVTHRNVANFFAGMDERLPAPAGSAWLAVTSLSFDISVLELFWPLARGFKVVLLGDEQASTAAIAAPPRKPLSHVDFSLYYFGSDESQDADKYRLLMEGARFGDANGFAAIWTPERHFHAFGGLYPNPSVLSAALAAMTKNLKIRAGSCVLPLHHPVRVAEEWAIVDNISNGRVGVSFAAGWQPNDFLLRPENFADRKNAMFRDIELVHRLWRGEQLPFKDGTGKEIKVRTLPRPLQKDLPTWVTVAGNPETFQQAGEIGAHLLTHLLGQSVEEVSEKVAIYRKAWQAKGHPGRGTVTLMLHTFVTDNTERARELVRGPFKEYLRSAVQLVKLAAWSFPTFKQKAAAKGMDPGGLFDSQDLTAEELEALLDHAFSRYYETSGLFGTPETCLPFVEHLQDIGVDEIACLVDFMGDTELVLENLPHLNRLRQLVERNTAASHVMAGEGAAATVAQLIQAHKITHLQCTPSMAGMLLADDAARGALRALQVMMVGGEALSPALANELKSAVSGPVLNMYGPTETTIWSTTATLAANSPVTIGRPIANTEIYVLDSHRRLVPLGAPGELYIGGDGVTRGYLHRPELTAERFVPNEFRPANGARLYRTGDLVRYRDDGEIEFLGRIDHQVKVRGYRIELGEIEARLREHTELREAIVVAREDEPGDKRLVAYVLTQSGKPIDAMLLRDFLRDQLPEYMVPTNFVTLTAYPLTPNGKIDRKSLPAPNAAQSAPKAEYQAPASEIEAQIAEIWQSSLQLEQVGVDDNFFDIGGHSLLAVKVHRELRDKVSATLSITDIFRFPTIRTLCQYLASDGSNPSLERSTERGSSRRDALARRRESRTRTGK